MKINKESCLSLICLDTFDPQKLDTDQALTIASSDILYLNTNLINNFLFKIKDQANIIDVSNLNISELVSLIQKNIQSGLNVTRIYSDIDHLFNYNKKEIEAYYSAGIKLSFSNKTQHITGDLHSTGILLSDKDSFSSVVLIDVFSNTPSVDYVWLSQSKSTLVFNTKRKFVSSITLSLTKNGFDDKTPVAAIINTKKKNPTVITGFVDDISEDITRLTSKDDLVYLVVGETAKSYKYFNSDAPKPLSGVSIAVTRSRDQAKDLVDGLKDLGASVTEVPLIKTHPLPLDSLDSLLDDVSAYSTIVFTSTNAVRIFFTRLKDKGLDLRSLGSCIVAVVGRPTFIECMRYGINPDVIPIKTNRTALGVLDALAVSAPLFGTKVAVIRASIGDDRLIEGLQGLGCDVNLVKVYETQLLSVSDSDIADLLACDVITLMSSSAANSLVKALENKTSYPPVITIGKQTTTAALWAGLTVLDQADDPSVSELIKTIERSYKINKGKRPWDTVNPRIHQGLELDPT